MVGGFPKRAQRPQTVPAETVQFDDEGRRLLDAPIAAAPRPEPTLLHQPKPPGPPPRRPPPGIPRLPLASAPRPTAAPRLAARSRGLLIEPVPA